VLRCFTHGSPKHPICQGLEELGRAVLTIFACESAECALGQHVHDGPHLFELRVVQSLPDFSVQVRRS
jgi:hypothetical protein